MTDQRIAQIRRAEAFSHTEAYNNLELFEAGSWLSKPVKTIMELIPYFKGSPSFRGLDLGCGIGRNCIPVLQALSHIPCSMDCVDILPIAIEKLRENAAKYGVKQSVNSILCAADQYEISKDHYDLILGISVLEHLDCEQTLIQKLHQIRDGLKKDGIACFVINTSIREHDKSTNMARNVQFEINLQTNEMGKAAENCIFRSGSASAKRHPLPI